jgi:hypothetical protein
MVLRRGQRGTTKQGVATEGRGMLDGCPPSRHDSRGVSAAAADEPDGAVDGPRALLAHRISVGA